MAQVDVEYRKLINHTLLKGYSYIDESRGCVRVQVPSYTFRHQFNWGFPAVTLKELAQNSVFSELLWFMRGGTNIKELVDQGNPIWNKDAYNWYCKYADERGFKKKLTYRDFVMAIKNGDTMESLESFHGGRYLGKYELGNVGANYSKQWRSYAGRVDQIVKLIKDMKANIMSTRLKVEAWNPAELDETALPPCHTGFQIVGIPLGEGKYGFELHWNQRSVDLFLGLPFNIASYAGLAKFLEELTGYKALAIEGNLKCVHLYDNSLHEVDVLLARDDCEYNFAYSEQCELKINMPDNYENLSVDEILNKLSPKDFVLDKYESYPPLRVPMLAPKSL